MAVAAASRTYTQELLAFINASPTPFHCVENAKNLLLKAGFAEVKERDGWAGKVISGGKYFVTRNGSSLIAFAVGKLWKPGNPIAVIGAHTDSCTLKLKPISKRITEKNTFLQVGVELYGGGLWHTWFDRSMGLSGRVILRDSSGNRVPKLIKIDKPILRVPSLPPHLDRQDPFVFNKETHLFPVLGLVEDSLNAPSSAKENDIAGTDEKDDSRYMPMGRPDQRHHPVIIELIAEAAGGKPEDIIDFELVCHYLETGVVGGINGEFIYSARLDDQEMSYCAIQGLINSTEADNALDKESGIQMISLFDNEEIGSKTAQGADSNFLPCILRRVCVLSGDKDYDFASLNTEGDQTSHFVTSTNTFFEESLAKSFLLSADMAHAAHPNYPEKFESEHRPRMNKGCVIKINANSRYATNAPGIVLIEECARLAEVPLQLVVVRNDSTCGSTIGPMLSAKTGIRTLDMGNCQLAMHSITEMGGAHDVNYAVKLFESFLGHYSTLEPTMVID